MLLGATPRKVIWVPGSEELVPGLGKTLTGADAAPAQGYRAP